MASSSTESSNSVASELAGSDLFNLYHVIDKDNVHGLNLAVPEDAKAVIKPWDEREDTTHFADSGVDDQIIIHIPFTQNVRIRSFLLKLGRGEFTPRHLRIYANYPQIVDFSDAETTKPHLNISLLEGQASVVEYPLRVAAFANVSSLSLFFADSTGGELSRVYYVGFKGDTRSITKEPSSQLNVPAANAADAPLFDRLSEKSGGQQTTAR